MTSTWFIGMPPAYARQIFGKAELQDQLLGLAERAGAGETLGPSLHLAKGLDIGGEPGKAVHRALLLIEELRGEIAILAVTLARTLSIAR